MRFCWLRELAFSFFEKPDNKFFLINAWFLCCFLSLWQVTCWRNANTADCVTRLSRQYINIFMRIFTIAFSVWFSGNHSIFFYIKSAWPFKLQFAHHWERALCSLSDLIEFTNLIKHGKEISFIVSKHTN